VTAPELTTPNPSKGWGLFLAKNRDFNLAIDKTSRAEEVEVGRNCCATRSGLRWNVTSANADLASAQIVGTDGMTPQDVWRGTDVARRSLVAEIGKRD
jgi:hypothetical protein